MEIIRTFTVPNNNECAKQNLLELWKDDRFHEVLRRALAPGTPDLLLPTVMVLIIHLTFHEDVVVTIWANQPCRAALLSAARLLDRTDGLAVDGPGRASTRLEAFTALHSLTFAQDNLAPLCDDEAGGRGPNHDRHRHGAAAAELLEEDNATPQG